MNIDSTVISDLRARGFRLTQQRLVILRILSESAEHMTPLEIYERARLEIPGITEPTVYRTLTFLASQGLALPTHSGERQLVYEFAGHNHHHLICRGCGHSQEIDHALLAPFFQQFQDDTGFHIDSVHLTFFGLCPECMKN